MTELSPSPAADAGRRARIAIVGGRGGVGQRLVSACVQQGQDVAVLDLPAAAAASDDAAESLFIGVDVCDDASKAPFRPSGNIGTGWINSSSWSGSRPSRRSRCANLNSPSGIASLTATFAPRTRPSGQRCR